MAASCKFSDAVTILPNRLYWVTLHTDTPPKNSAKSHYFSIDNTCIYEPFFSDFGPLNLGVTYRYCKMLDDMLKDPALSEKRIIHYCSTDPKKRANAAYLIASYMVIVRRGTASTAFAPFESVFPSFLPFHDASSNESADSFELTVLNCLEGIQKSMDCGLFKWEGYDVESYEFFEKVENGDLNWILPNKFLAFVGPSPTSMDEDGHPALVPEDYVPLFLEAGIHLVIRLNRKEYDHRRFTNHGIKHYDLYMSDGTCPSREIIDKFLSITEAEPGPCAVHCKAGLGRTGTLIGLYAMKHHGFAARAFIGWNRICRPGSVLGPQQQFLCDMEEEMLKAGELMRRLQAPPPTSEAEIRNQRSVRPNIKEHSGQLYEDRGQGEGLRRAKQTSLRR